MKIHIFYKNFSKEGRDRISAALAHAGIGNDDLKFMNVDYEEVNPSSDSFILCLERTFQTVSRACVKNGILKASQLIGQDVVDSNTGFAIFNLAMKEEEVFGTEEDKDFAWAKFCKMAEAWKVINDGRANNSNTEVVSNPAVDTTSDQPVVANYFMVLKSLVAELDLSEPSLGKSLKDKICIPCASGDVFVYPNGRIPDDGNHNLSFKDLVVILRAMQIFNVDKLSFEKID